MIKKILAGTFVILLLFVGICHSAEDSNITITNDDYDDKWYKEVEWFSVYNVGDDAGTTYKYNELEETGDNAGLVEARKYNLRKTIQIDLITLGSTSVDVRAEGRAGSSAEWGEIGTINFTGTTGANNAFTFPIHELYEEIRIGVKANTPGTDSITISGILLGDGR